MFIAVFTITFWGFIAFVCNHFRYFKFFGAIFILIVSAFLVYIRVESNIGADALSYLSIAKLGEASPYAANGIYSALLYYSAESFGIFTAYQFLLILNISLLIFAIKNANIPTHLGITLWFLLFFVSFQIGKQASGLAIMVCTAGFYSRSHFVRLIALFFGAILHTAGLIFLIIYLASILSCKLLPKITYLKLGMIMLAVGIVGVFNNINNLQFISTYIDIIPLLNAAKAEVILNRMQNNGGEYYGFRIQIIGRIFIEAILITVMFSVKNISEMEFRMLLIGVLFSTFFLMFPILSVRGVEGLTVLKVVVLSKIINQSSQNMKIRFKKNYFLSCCYIGFHFLCPILGDLSRLIIK